MQEQNIIKLNIIIKEKEKAYKRINMIKNEKLLNAEEYEQASNILNNDLVQ